MERRSASSPATASLEEEWEDHIPVQHILRPSPVLDPEDSLRKAMDLLHRTPEALVPVVKHGSLVGVVGQDNLNNGRVRRAIDARDPSLVRVRELMEPPPPPLPGYLGLVTALEVMDHTGRSVLPVSEPSGLHLGVISRSELVSHLTRATRPERMGGMATPLGVYLTSGIARAGPGDLGLALAGFVLCLMLAGALAVVFAAAWLVERYTGVGLVRGLLAMGTAAAASPASGPELAVAGAYAFLFALLFRLSPLAGLHAAEHQVVNAVEHGEDLQLDAVRRMSPVHPRCGTNLAVVAVMASFFGLLMGVNATSLPILALIVVLLRMPMGSLAQKFVTTRPPTDRQLLNGIAVGEELIRRHRAARGQPSVPFTRIWNMGILQSLAGFAVAMFLIEALLHFLGFDWLSLL